MPAVPAPVAINQQASSSRQQYSNQAQSGSIGNHNGSFNNGGGMSISFSYTNNNSFRPGSLSSLMALDPAFPGGGHPSPSSVGALLGTSLSSSVQSDTCERLPRLERTFCQGYHCCGLVLNDLHCLLEHFEEKHVLQPRLKHLVENLQSNNGDRMVDDDSDNDIDLDPNNDDDADATDDENHLPNSSSNNSSGLHNNPNNINAMNILNGLNPQLRQLAQLQQQQIQQQQNKSSTPSSPSIDSRPPSAFSAPPSPRHAASAHSALKRRAVDDLSQSFDMDLDLDDDDDEESESGNSNNPSQQQQQQQQQIQQQHNNSNNGNNNNSNNQNRPTNPTLNNINTRCLAPALLYDPDHNTSSPVSEIDAFSSSNIASFPPTPVPGSPSEASSSNNALMNSPAAMNGASGMAPDKPYKCQVPGCDKSYKQANGLKYHRLHGHCNQNAFKNQPPEKLDENGMPSSRQSTPAHFEEKPFGCYLGPYQCSKRYKNMNGLRYHYQHAGSHGQIGLNMLANGTHPPPALPAGATAASHRRAMEREREAAAQATAESRNQSPAPSRSSTPKLQPPATALGVLPTTASPTTSLSPATSFSFQASSSGGPAMSSFPDIDRNNNNNNGGNGQHPSMSSFPIS